ncbi:Chondroitinase-B precursor [Maioricimonas rarisocia]|uniref:Chondroitinase-B n=2 Tax=Maioricimonas rarisocia TaxID=2528026 RepID=A0A517Z933_9PLAN|nr:Chondroitinase-B precursor [Maioricimonas rarisocia]
MGRAFTPAAVIVLCVWRSVAAAEFPVRPETDVEPLTREVQAGDVIVLQNGTWRDADLKFERLPGTEDEPIHIRAETPGQVVLTGQTEFRFSGTHVVVSGLVFRNTDGVSDVMQLRTHSERHAHHCRVTDCVFEQTPEGEAGSESRWLSVYGTNNRIDHCDFAGKRSRGPTLVVWVNEEVEQHRIDHNHFGSRPPLGRNGGETIRIGTSEVSELDCRSIVEDNYFHACDGEAEIISNKSCENVYRHNLFEACAGALTLRHGHRCRVEGNVFLGRTKGGTGGVRIIGQQHSVTNNYFEGLRGDAERAAICLMNGIPNGSLNGYAPVEKAVVSHNTFVDCKVSVEIGVGVGRRQSAEPADCRFTHNAFLPDKWPVFRVHVQPRAFVWEANRLESDRMHENELVTIRRSDLLFTRHDDGLLRPVSAEGIRTGIESGEKYDLDGHPRSDATLAGCDDPSTPLRQLPSAATTGPSWRTRQ